MASTNQLSVLFLGHSYARRARDHRIEKRQSPYFIPLGNTILNFTYIFKGGQNYHFFYNDTNIRKRIESCTPDIILIALAGNAVSKKSFEYPMPTAQADMRIFHEWLTLTFPNAKIIPIEAEPRFNPHCELPPDHDPLTESYRNRRRTMNNAIQRMRGKHATVLLYNIFQDRSLFIPYECHGRCKYVHLNYKGYEIYWDLILNCLHHNLIKWNLIK